MEEARHFREFNSIQIRRLSIMTMVSSRGFRESAWRVQIVLYHHLMKGVLHEDSIIDFLRIEALLLPFLCHLRVK